jgi:hypothetical protein
VGKGFSARIADRAAKPGDVAGDHEYLMRAVLKIDAIREDLGSVGPVIARQIEEAMLGRRSGLDTASAEAKAAKARKFVAAEKRLAERIARLHERLMEAKNDFHLSSEHIARAVKVALELAEKPALKAIESIEGEQGNIFAVPVLSGSGGRATIGLEHPHTGFRRPITFDHDVAKGRDDVVLAHLEHRLVQMCLRLLREEIWKLDDVKRLHRVAVRSIPDSASSVPVVAVWSRLVITGGDHQRLHEELTLAGGELEHKRFARIPQIGKLEALLAQASSIEPGQALFDVLKERFERHEDALMAAVEARSRERLKSLENTLDRRMKSEIDDVQTVLDELATSIRQELKPDRQSAQLYLPGLSPEELAQVKKDVHALEARLARIPEEREKEKSVIEKHYANPVDRTFPVAVVFIVPQSLARRG